MLFKRAILIFVVMWDITSAYLSPLLLEMRYAHLLIKFLHSLPIPPEVENIRGVNVLFSTLMTLELYYRFLEFSFSAYNDANVLFLYDGALA